MNEQTEKLPVAERAHHPYSPSKLQYLEVSPCYCSDEKKVSQKSLDGTAQHDAAEEHVNIDDPALTDTQAGAVAMCKSYRDGIIAKYPGAIVIKEEYLPVDDCRITNSRGVVFHGTTAGYLDVAILSADKKRAEILDWKFGAWSVEPAENNLQGMAYLLGLYHKFPTLEEVTVHFVLPHREEIDVHTFKKPQFEEMLLRVKTVVARAHFAQTKGDFSACKVMTPCCMFCGNKAICDKLAETVLKVGNKYSPVKIPENVTPSLFLDPKTATQSMEIAQLMEAWAKAVRAQITAKSIEDDAWTPDGYKLKSRADSEIVDQAKFVALLKSLGVTDARLEQCKKFNLTATNKAVADLNPRGEKEKAVIKFREQALLDGALVKESPIYFLERNRT